MKVKFKLTQREGAILLNAIAFTSETNMAKRLDAILPYLLLQEFSHRVQWRIHLAAFGNTKPINFTLNAKECIAFYFTYKKAYFGSFCDEPTIMEIAAKIDQHLK